MALPTLVYNPKTKINGDIEVYGNLGVGILKARLGLGSNIPVVPCVSGQECPVGSFDATILTTPNKGAVGTIPAGAPVFTAAEGLQLPSVAGDSAELWCLPDPANDFLICFDQGIQPTLGEQFRAVPRKLNPVDHYVRQRGEFSLQLTDYFIGNWDGIQQLRGRPVTIIVKVLTEGGGNFQEIQYYNNVLLNVPPVSSAADANANIEVQGTGNFSSVAVFSAPKV